MKRVLITGATGDLGIELCMLYAKNKYEVIIHYNNNYDKAKEINNNILKKYGINSMMVKCDITSSEEVSKMFFKTGNIDILINNAAICMDNDFSTKNSSDFMKVINTNISGTFNVCQKAVKYINKGGVIVNVSSNNGIDNYNEYSIDYDASKAAINNMTLNLANILSPNIRVIAVAPGWIETTKNLKLNPTFKKNEQDKILFNRFAKIEEITEVIYFLTSDKASYINKTVIKIDGGLK